MAEMALQHMNPSDVKRRSELEALRQSIEVELAHRTKRQLEETKPRDCFGKLPVEIAVAVYRLLVAEDHACVITLSHICQGWRRVVVSTPSLWHTLSLSHKKPIPKAKLWKVRGQGKFTTLCLRNASEALRALEVLHDLSLEPLRSLTVDQLKSQDVMSALPHLTQSILDNLDSITLTRVDFSLGTHSTPPWFQHTLGLSLRHLVAEASLIDWAKVADHSECLVHLDSTGLLHRHIPDLLWLLSRNTHLEELILQFSPLQSLEPDPPARQLPAQIHLQHLTSLELRGYDRLAYGVLSSLALPNLRSVKFIRLGSLLDSCLQHVLAGGCIPKLESFEILYGDPDKEIIVRLLELATALKSLRLVHMANIAPVLEALARPPRPAPEGNGTINMICPQLTSVDLSGSPEVSDGPIVRLVKGRNPNISPTAGEEAATSTDSSAVVRLHMLAIDGCEKISPDIVPWLRQQVPRVSCVYATKQQARWKR